MKGELTCFELGFTIPFLFLSTCNFTFRTIFIQAYEPVPDCSTHCQGQLWEDQAHLHKKGSSS